ncbi:chromophore lyase CpcT/CpeT [uncultured Lacinutrix sp.]|uniref:chromophore lyase CpcT/CpeT n=1 Tax=uncultured Lacinutrix sp. TaxID=574032 RepID=UPI002621CC5B|nr:chromophore lyase CpcT/CpeT [uncultured Lacinutrix sp.]
MKYFTFLFLLTCLTSCKDDIKTNDAKDASIDNLYSLMQGSFDSGAQAKADSTYYNISLHMYPIWEGKGHFLYVEQALSSMQNKPYRQRVYELKKLSDSTIGSYIYKIPNDSLWIGKWKTPKAFDSINLDQLELKNGCEVILQKIAKNTYKGATGINTCESTMRGASYATSQVEITKDKIMSWDRGFNKDNEYVWGAEKSGYIFNKTVK